MGPDVRQGLTSQRRRCFLRHLPGLLLPTFLLRLALSGPPQALPLALPLAIPSSTPAFLGIPGHPVYQRDGHSPLQDISFLREGKISLCLPE